ncbi:MAG: (2Fe-2S)-binding protein [Nitrospinae bacterium]|nr:(2Fe-2S)-binding protein [Nitrospinota bacterium]MDA1109449.1 (2Fe-2S)-binding protein [Nitrospinota bacterium]
MEPTAVENDEIICKCYQVSESTIRYCIESGNLTTIEQVTKACEAGGGCHSCHILIDLFIDEHQGKTTPMETLVATHAKKVKKRGILGRFFNKIKSGAPAPK